MHITPSFIDFESILQMSPVMNDAFINTSELGVSDLFHEPLIRKYRTAFEIFKLYYICPNYSKCLTN